MEADDTPTKESSHSKLSYKAKLTGIISGAFEKAFYFEQLLLDDIDHEVDKFQEVNYIKTFL